jgi:hypothetical protein
MFRRMLRVRRLPFGQGLDVLLVAGAAYFAWEHEQGKHERPHALCLICWLDKVAPASEPPGDTGPAGPSSGEGQEKA